MSLYYLRKAREEKKTYHSEVSKLSFMDILRKDAEDDAARLREMLGIKDDGTYEQRAERPKEKKPEEKPKKKVKPPETRVLFGQVGYKQKDKER